MLTAPVHSRRLQVLNELSLASSLGLDSVKGGKMTRNVLHIDASAQVDGSTTRQLTAEIVKRLKADSVIRRDLALALPHITQDWISAKMTPAESLTDAQRDELALSDVLVDEIDATDTLVIGVPLYNFSVPASLKAWIDLIARAGRTFEYTETGPRGLLSNKTAIIVISTGGVPVGSPIDFASGYLRHFLSFIGFEDIQIITAEGVAIDANAAMNNARDQIHNLAI